MIAVLKNGTTDAQIENDLRYSTMPRSVLETALIKASMPENDYNIDALMARIAQLEEQIKNGQFSLKKAETCIESCQLIEVKHEKTSCLVAAD